MTNQPNVRHAVTFLFVALLLSFSTLLQAQTMQLVWADEFNGTAIDQTKWSLKTGVENANYYTDRTDNVRIQDGKLQIIVQKEPYQGMNYTSGRVRTRYRAYWRYGRIEARIRLPGASGLVPAFWMMPEDDIYGWWPRSGEMDIMEYPTHGTNTVYGSLHSKRYGFLTGTPPKGGTMQVPTAETEFHIYAIEWTPDRIDFYVDDYNYYSYNNPHSGYEKWPYDQPYHIIANIGVGGGWVGDPDENETFPAMMEIDYVRVYQALDDIGIVGDDFVRPNARNTAYTVPQIPGASYVWSVPSGAGIRSGQHTHAISVDWGNAGSYLLGVAIITGEGSHVADFPVEVIDNLLKNPGMEKGIKYWSGNVGYPAQGSVDLEPPSADHNSQSVKYRVDALGNYSWEVQLRQGGFTLQRGKQYDGSFRAKADANGRKAVAAIVNAQTFAVYHSKEVTFTDQWQKYEFHFTAPEHVAVAFHVDMGFQTGSYYLDDLMFNPHPANQINVTFCVTAPSITPQDDTVYLTGSFNAWDPGPSEPGTNGSNQDIPLQSIGDNQWQVTVPFSANETIEYKFTRGSWETVETDAGGNEIPSRALTIPGYDYTQPDTIAQWNDLQNMLQNGDFAEADSNWKLTVFWPGQASGSVQNGEYVVSIDHGGNYLWDINLTQADLPVDHGKRYRVSFDAYADAPRQISALVGKNSDPWNVYSGDNKFSLTTSKQSYSYMFTMNDPTDPIARLAFDLGLSTEDVYFDNVGIYEVVVPSGVDQAHNSTLPAVFSLSQNYPNPFNPTTAISYQLSAVSQVILAIYNINGQLIRTLVQGEQAAGVYRVEWDGRNDQGMRVASGIYMYRIEVHSDERGQNQLIMSRKMILMK